MLEAALAYAAGGYSVFPLIEKRPAVSGGFYEATTDYDQIVEWWQSAKPVWNIGIRTGISSGIWALDVDRKQNGPNGFKTLQSLTGDFEWVRGVPFQISASGGHFFFRCDDVELAGSAGKIGPGLDVRANGGYIVASPSIHPNTGLPYCWNNGRSILTHEVKSAPSWLLELAKKPKFTPSKMVAVVGAFSSAYGMKALAGECQKIENAGNGNQAQALNDASFRVGKLISMGALNEFEAVEGLKRAALDMVNYDLERPWQKTEIERKISKAISDGKQAI